jgi:hypothetical protein
MFMWVWGSCFFFWTVAFYRFLAPLQERHMKHANVRDLERDNHEYTAPHTIILPCCSSEHTPNTVLFTAVVVYAALATLFCIGVGHRIVYRKPLWTVRW